MHQLLYYGSFAAGLLLAALCSVRTGRRNGMTAKDAAMYTVTGFLSGVLGAVLMAQVYNAVLKAVSGGAPFAPATVSLYGGLLLTPLLTLIPVRLTKADYRAVTDACAAGVYLLLGTAKLGCFAYGCCRGVDCAFGTVNRFSGTRVFPVQLLEAALSYGIALLLYRLTRRAPGSAGRTRRALPCGAAYPVGLILYGAARFFVQFLRAHEIAAEADLVAFLDLWQVVSCIAVLTGAVWLAFLCRRGAHPAPRNERH